MMIMKFWRMGDVLQLKNFFRLYSVSFRRYSRVAMSYNHPKYAFWPQILRRRTTNFVRSFANMAHFQTCGKVWLTPFGDLRVNTLVRTVTVGEH